MILMTIHNALAKKRRKIALDNTAMYKRGKGRSMDTVGRHLSVGSKTSTMRNYVIGTLLLLACQQGYHSWSSPSEPPDPGYGIYTPSPYQVNLNSNN